MNEHLDYFNRWQKTYLMWAYSNFDRIVVETVKKHKEKREKEKYEYYIITHTFGTGTFSVGDVLTF